MAKFADIMRKFISSEGEYAKFEVVNKKEGDIEATFDGNLAVLSFFLCRAMVSAGKTKEHINQAWDEAEKYVGRYES